MKRLPALFVAAQLVLLPSYASSQTRPTPPGSTEPIRLTSPRIPPLAESQWTDHHRELVAEYAPDGRVGNGLGEASCQTPLITSSPTAAPSPTVQLR